MSTEKPTGFPRASALERNSRKRKFAQSSAPRDVQPYVDNSWHAVRPDEVTQEVIKMCDDIIAALTPFASKDSKAAELIIVAEHAKRLPNIEKFHIAVLGMQGVGKSTAINAVLQRGLLDRSGRSVACTVNATVIEHKEGADDNTRKSDVVVGFLTTDQIKECCKEQIRHLVEPSDRDNRDGGQLSERDDIDHIDDEDLEAPKDDSMLRENRIATAREFFQILFGTEKNEERQEWLDLQLDEANIKRPHFLQQCCEAAQERLRELEAIFGMNDGELKFQDVNDRDFTRKAIVIKKYWPLIKVVTIRTGHVLLRHGVVFYDVPGYGDISHLREGISNTFRWKADMEMIVTPCSRTLTSVLQNRYIDTSIRMGENRTILVMNQSDAIINEQNMTNMIQARANEFPGLYQRMEDILSLEEELDFEEDDLSIDSAEDTIRTLRADLLKDAIPCFVKLETKETRYKMQRKGVPVFLTSADTYLQWCTRTRTQDPAMSKQVAGIDRLREFLAKLPAKSNYNNYRKHVFETLPALRNKAARILETHREDPSYAGMRQALSGNIPLLQRDSTRIVQAQLEDQIKSPWSTYEKFSNGSAIRGMIAKDWKHPDIYHAGFLKILREYGMPMNGKYRHRNLNDELLQTMKSYIDAWCEKTNVGTSTLARTLDAFVQTLIQRTRADIVGSSATKALRQRAEEELANTSRRIKLAYDNLLSNLRQSLRQIHVRHTTEIDINSPIAEHMKSRYEESLQVRGGHGAYRRRTERLARSILEASSSENDGILLQQIETRIVNALYERWQEDCAGYLGRVVCFLTDFAVVLEELVMDPNYQDPEHARFRAVVKTLIEGFDARLEKLKSRFVVLESDASMKEVISEDEWEGEILM